MRLSSAESPIISIFSPLLRNRKYEVLAQTKGKLPRPTGSYGVLLRLSNRENSLLSAPFLLDSRVLSTSHLINNKSNSKNEADGTERHKISS